MGYRTSKVVAKGVLQMYCSICTENIKNDLPIRNHVCNIYQYGSSGSIASTLYYALLNDLHDSTCGKINIGQLVTDDDSTLRQYCSSVENDG